MFGRCFSFRTYPDGHPKSGLKQEIWDDSLLYQGPERVAPAFYEKLINKVLNAKPAAWKAVSICSATQLTSKTYVKNRWREFVSSIQADYQCKITKKNFTLLCGEWLKRKHNTDKGRRGNDTCGLKTVELWATAVSKAFIISQNYRRRKKFIHYRGLAVVFPNWQQLLTEIKRAAPLRRASEPKNWLKQRDLFGLWIKCFGGTYRSNFTDIDSLTEDQYFAVHEKFIYTTCTRGGEISKKTRKNDAEYNRTHLGLYHNNLSTKVFQDSHFDKFGLGLRGGNPADAANEPCGLVGWLDRQKNEAMVSGDVHNKIYIPLCDSAPADLVRRFPCLGFCNNRFVMEVLLGIRLPVGARNLPLAAGGLAPLFPPKEHVPVIKRLLALHMSGQTVEPADFAKYFVNFEKTWPDTKRRELFADLIVDPDVLANVSGHCWRGGLRPCWCTSTRNVGCSTSPGPLRGGAFHTRNTPVF